jgi:hypothetical protein
MKRILACFAALLAASAFGATTLPVQLLNPTGSTVGQTIVSTGSGSAPGWGTVPLSGLSAVAANTVIANFTGASATPTAFSMPSCSTSSSALQYTSGTGVTCSTAINAATLLGFNWATPGAIGATTPSTGAFTTLSASSTVSGSGFSAYLASPPAIGGTAAAAGSFTTLSASGTLTGFTGRLLNVQVFSSNGTYTPTTGTAKVIVKVQAPGGGTGGNAATSTGQSAVSQSGSSGAYGEVFYSSGVTSQTVTIGAVGAAGASGANTGGTGGTTSFGSLISCPGGNGGVGGSAVSAASIVGGSNLTSACTVSGGTTIASIPGNGGSIGIVVTAGSIQAEGSGANSPMGLGGRASVSGIGTSGTGYGSSASGLISGASTAAQAGLAGQPGLIVVYEFSQ